MIKKGRTERAIVNKAFKLKISKDNKWRCRELSFLRKSYKRLEVYKIAKKLRRSKIAIWGKAYDIGLKRRIKLNLPLSAYVPSANLAWLVGYLLGDGYLTTCWTIGAKTKDNDLKEFYLKIFKKWSKFKKEKFIIKQEKGKYNDAVKGRVYVCKRKWVVRVCSKEAWQFLKQFQDNPLYCLKFFLKEYWKFVLKGLWDTEGHITSYKDSNRMVVGFSNSNKKILRLYEKICSDLGFHTIKVKRSDETIIDICSLAEVLDFVEKIGITIRRKEQKIRNKINEIKKKRNIYYKAIKMKEKGLKRKQILEKLSGFLSPGTFDGWIYSDTKPYYIENAKLNKNKIEKDGRCFCGLFVR